MSNSIEQHNINAESYKALVTNMTSKLHKAGYHVETKVKAATGDYRGCYEETTIRVIFGKSNSEAYNAYKSRIAAAKITAKALVEKHSIKAGEIRAIDAVLDLADDPYAAFDGSENIVATIRGTSQSNVAGHVDTVAYTIYNLYAATDSKASYDSNGVTGVRNAQRTSIASGSSINRWSGRPINPESTAKRLVKIIADNLSMIVSDLYWVERANDATIADERRQRAKYAAEADHAQSLRATINSVVPGSVLTKVEQAYGENAIKVQFNIPLDKLVEFGIAADNKYPDRNTILEAVAAYMRAKVTAPTNFPPETQTQTKNTHTNMAYYKPNKTLTISEIEQMLKEARDPFIAVLGKHHSEVDPERDLPDMIRIHNATVEAIEDLHQRVAKLEAQLAAVLNKTQN